VATPLCLKVSGWNTLDGSDVLNLDQQKAADQLSEFLASNETEFCLTGQAGTGKTYMLYSILGDRAKYCATTNKAASVLRTLTGIAETIHSLLKLTVRNDFRTGKTFLARSPKAKPYDGQVIVIDEASMIDRQLYGIIREMCGGSKVIYVGDDAQLAPIQGSNFSIFKLGIKTLLRSQNCQQHFELQCSQEAISQSRADRRPLPELMDVMLIH
jgi:ATP-dependent exoDNAse (exonuclease V) alpha subunit